MMINAIIVAVSATLFLQVVEGIKIPGTIKFGLFPGITPVDPTEIEFDDVMERITDFWAIDLGSTIPGGVINSFEASYTCHSFDAVADHPITIGVEFDVDVTSSGVALPNQLGQQIASALVKSDFKEFIRNAVWPEDQLGIFWEVNFVWVQIDPSRTVPIICEEQSEEEVPTSLRSLTKAYKEPSRDDKTTMEESSSNPDTIDATTVFESTFESSSSGPSFSTSAKIVDVCMLAFLAGFMFLL